MVASHHSLMQEKRKRCNPNQKGQCFTGAGWAHQALIQLGMERGLMGQEDGKDGNRSQMALIHQHPRQCCVNTEAFGNRTASTQPTLLQDRWAETLPGPCPCDIAADIPLVCISSDSQYTNFISRYTPPYKITPLRQDSSSQHCQKKSVKNGLRMDVSG